MKLLIPLVIIVISFNAFAQKNRTWSYDGGKIQLIETDHLTWELNGQLQSIPVSEQDKDNYSGELVISEQNIDYTLSIFLGASYQKILVLLNQESFRNSFENRPMPCTHGANGFLMINNNMSAKMVGHCLFESSK